MLSYPSTHPTATAAIGLALVAGVAHYTAGTIPDRDGGINDTNSDLGTVDVDGRMLDTPALTSPKKKARLNEACGSDDVARVACGAAATHPVDHHERPQHGRTPKWLVDAARVYRPAPAPGTYTLPTYATQVLEAVRLLPPGTVSVTRQQLASIAAAAVACVLLLDTLLSWIAGAPATSSTSAPPSPPTGLLLGLLPSLPTVASFATLALVVYTMTVDTTQATSPHVAPAQVPAPAAPCKSAATHSRAAGRKSRRTRRRRRRTAREGADRSSGAPVADAETDDTSTAAELAAAWARIDSLHDEFTPASVAEAVQLLEIGPCVQLATRAGPKADASRLWRLARARNGQRLLLARQHESPSAAVKQQLLALTDEGLAFAEQALARNDQDANVHKWIATLLAVRALYCPLKEVIGNAYKVRDHAIRAAELNPSDPFNFYGVGQWYDIVAGLGYAKRKLAAWAFGSEIKGTYEEAYAYYKKAEHTSPRFWVRNALKLATVCANLKRVDEGKRYLQQAKDMRAAGMEWEQDDTDELKIASKRLRVAL